MTAGKCKVSMTAAAFLLLGFVSNHAWPLSAVAVADGGNWSDPATWDIGAVPGVEDTAFIRNGYTVTLSAMEDVKLLNIGDLASAGTVNIVEGGKKTFTLLKAGRISSKAPSVTLKNFAEGAKYRWDVSQSTFTVTTP